MSLVLVATPIGNLGDLSPRAVATMSSADLICCEDTRRTRALLSAAGVSARRRLVSLHAHNEATRIPDVLGALERGKTVVVVSDAGMPGVSDPGSRLVAAAVAAGATVTCVPGPSAVLAALVVSGLPTERFRFEGFLERRASERRRHLGEVLAGPTTAVVLEAPGRVAATLADIASLDPDRPVAVCRELTKLHEEVWRGSAQEAADEFGARSEVRGEVVVVVGGAPQAPPPTEDLVRDALRSSLGAGRSTRDAADEVAGALGVSRRRAYEAALAEQRRGLGGGGVGG